MAFCTGSNKNDKEEFTQDYCNRGERVNPEGSKDCWEQSGVSADGKLLRGAWSDMMVGDSRQSDLERFFAKTRLGRVKVGLQAKVSAYIRRGRRRS